MKAVIEDIYTFSSLIKSLHRLSNQAFVELNTDGMRMTSSDDDEICVCCVFLKWGFFKKYEVTKLRSLVLELEPITKFIQNIRGTQLMIRSRKSLVSLSYMNGGDVHQLTFDTGDFNTTKTVDKSLGQPLATIDMAWSTFREMVNDITVVGDEVMWEIREGSLSLKTQRLGNIYRIKLAKRKCSIHSVLPELVVAIPMRFIKNLPMGLHLSDPITIVIGSEYLTLRAEGAENKFRVDCLVSARKL